MTCIVGLLDKGKVYIGGDSAGVGNSEIRVRSDEKVFKVGDMIFGFTSSFRMGQLIRYTLKIPRQPKNMDDFKYMVTLFINSLKTCFRLGGFGSMTEGGKFLVGYKNALYMVDNDYQIGKESDGYSSVGCGEAYALGSLYSTKHNGDPIKRVNTALESAAKFSTGVRAPFNIVSL